MLRILTIALCSLFIGILDGSALAVDPMEYIGKPPLGLAAVPQKPDNPVTKEKAELGAALYFDPRLSIDGSISCASCHNPSLGFSNALPVAIGFKGQKGTRNSPTIYNSGYEDAQFWDGRALTLEKQAFGPLENPVEMGPQKLDQIAARLNAIRGYRQWFQKIFDGPATPERIGKAIATYERTILSGNAPVDRFVNGDTSALSPQAQRGFALFKGKGNCTLCHVGFNFADGDYHNIGVGMSKKKPDLGRFEITRNPADKGKFKTPSMREIADTGPYMHDGSVKTLEAVVELYNRGGEKNFNLDKQIVALHLTEAENADLVAFLKEGLRGERLTIMFTSLPQ